MEQDERLLNTAIEKGLKEPVFRLYGWTPACVSLGRNQRENGIDESFCKKNNIQIVRRLTGGRALLHEKELTYSFVAPVQFLKNGQSVSLSYREISGALIEGMNSFGVKVSFPKDKKIDAKHEYCMLISTGADLCFEGKKLIGSAQFRKQGYILQHGSILYDCDFEKIEKVFGEKPKSDEITFLNKIKPAFDSEELCFCLKNGFENYFNLKFD